MTTSNFDARVLSSLFRSLFAKTHQTHLLGGADEPLYQPAPNQHSVHIIHFSHDYFASALHEVAHWCIAGQARRQRVDYGYWYVPDGRNAEQQAAFERVEVKPQALEWIFCVAAGCRFRISADNLDGAARVSDDFKQAIWRQTQSYCRRGLPLRGQQFADSLRHHFGGGDFRQPDNYCHESLA